MLARLCSPNRSLKMAFHWNQESERAEEPKRNQVFAHLNVILSNPFVSFVWSPCGFPLQGLST